MTQRRSYLQQIAIRASHDPAPVLRPRRFVRAVPQAKVDDAAPPARPLEPQPATVKGIARTVAEKPAMEPPIAVAPPVAVAQLNIAPPAVRAVHESEDAPLPPRSPRAGALVPPTVIARDVVTVEHVTTSDHHASAEHPPMPAAASPAPVRAVEPRRLSSRPVAAAPEPLLVALAAAVRWTATNESAPPATRGHANSDVAEPELPRPAPAITPPSPAPPARATASPEITPPRASTPIERAPRVAPAVQIGTIEIEVIWPPAPALAPAPTPPAAAAPSATPAAPLSRGLTSAIGLRQS